jgi:hypothetical protein
LFRLVTDVLFDLFSYVHSFFSDYLVDLGTLCPSNARLVDLL